MFAVQTLNHLLVPATTSFPFWLYHFIGFIRRSRAGRSLRASPKAVGRSVRLFEHFASKFPEHKLNYMFITTTDHIYWAPENSEKTLRQCLAKCRGMNSELTSKRIYIYIYHPAVATSISSYRRQEKLNVRFRTPRRRRPTGAVRAAWAVNSMVAGRSRWRSFGQPSTFEGSRSSPRGGLGPTSNHQLSAH